MLKTNFKTEYGYDINVPQRSGKAVDEDKENSEEALSGRKRKNEEPKTSQKKARRARPG